MYNCQDILILCHKFDIFLTLAQDAIYEYSIVCHNESYINKIQNQEMKIYSVNQTGYFDN